MWCFALLALAGARPTPQIIEALDKKFLALSKAGGSVGSRAEELHAEAQKALKDEAPAEMQKVAEEARDWLADLSKQQVALKTEEETDKLRAQAERLEPKVDAATKQELATAVEGGDADQLRVALKHAEQALADRIAKLTSEQANLTAQVQDSKMTELLRLLRERQSLPMATQMAALHRPLFQELPEVAELKGVNGSLYKELQKLLPQARLSVVEPELDIHHDSGRHSESRRVFVVSSKLKQKVADMAASMEKMLPALRASVADKNGNAAAVAEGKQVLANIEGALAKVHASHDMAEQLKLLEGLEAGLVSGLARASGDSGASGAAPSASSDAESAEPKEKKARHVGPLSFFALG